MAEAGGVAKGGQVARMPGIPADAGAGHYVIENLHGIADSRQFADEMKAVTRQFYGTAGDAFMEALTEPGKLKETRETIRDGITEIVRLMRIQEGAAPEVGRIAARFALVAFAGELATNLGADEKALFAQATAFLQANGASRFPPYDISEEELRRVLNRAGFSHITESGVSYYIFTPAAAGAE